MSLTGSVDPVAHPEHLVSLDHPAVGQLTGATAKTGVAASASGWRSTRLGVRRTSHRSWPRSGGRPAGVQRKRHSEKVRSPSWLASTATALFAVGGTTFAVAICAEAGFDAPFDAAVEAPEPDWCSFRLLPVSMAAAPTKPPGAKGSPGGRPAVLGDARRHAARLGVWVALAGQADQPLTRTSPDWPPWSHPMGSWRPGCRTGTKES